MSQCSTAMQTTCFAVCRSKRSSSGIAAQISGEFNNALVSSWAKQEHSPFSIPVGADGYVGRECTDLACKKFFKVKPGTGVANAKQAFCPYCGHADNPGDFMT